MKKIVVFLSLIACFITLRAEKKVEYAASAIMSGASGEFAPLYNSALTHGVVSSKFTFLGRGGFFSDLNLNDRFSWGIGIDLLGGIVSGHDWERYDADTQNWFAHYEHPARAWVQQLYGEVKWRGCYATVGLKEHSSALLTQSLTSGDLVESGNARPIPELRIGFVDFQNIPFTNGWVQIQGEISYGKMTDSDWWDNRLNHYNGHFVAGEWYNYKRCYFRTKPSTSLSVTLGMQAADVFGGTLYQYERGVLIKRDKHPVKLKTLFNALLPLRTGAEGFYEGNHLGSWDFKARYRLPGENGEVSTYFEWPWEDGSGIGRRNGWDGLWGIEWQGSLVNNRLTGIVVEYLDFTNQSGPMHYAPADFPGETINTEATGADDYYNNTMYNSYANYGLSIGTPMLMAPAYNLDGYMAYIGNRLRGFHIAAQGDINSNLSWDIRGGYRKAWGNAKVILPHPISSTSVAASVKWNVKRVPGLEVQSRVAYDHGDMPCKSFGVMATVSYKGDFLIK